jgi:hypothetical protein
MSHKKRPQFGSWKQLFGTPKQDREKTLAYVRIVNMVPYRPEKGRSSFAYAWQTIASSWHSP